MLTSKQLGSEHKVFIPNRNSEGKKCDYYLSSSHKNQWVANNLRVPPRKVYTTDVSKLKNRLFAFNQKSCSLSIGTVVGSFRYICSWGKLFGMTFSFCLMLWSTYYLSVIKDFSRNQRLDDLFFYTNLTCLLSSILCLITLFISMIHHNIKQLNANLMDNSSANNKYITNSGSKIWNFISLKSLFLMYLLVAILAVFPISLFPLDSSQYLTLILSIILFAHLIPSILFYFAYLRGEDFRMEDRRLSISI